MEKAVSIKELVKSYEGQSDMRVIEYDLHEIVVRMVLFFVSGFAVGSLSVCLLFLLLHSDEVCN